MSRPRWFAPFGVFVREDWLDERTRSRLIAGCSRDRGDEAAIARREGVLTVDTDVRRVWELALDEDLHDALAGRLSDLVPELEVHFGVALEPCDALSVLRYPPGAYYRPHRDAATGVDPRGLHRRAVSVVVFVNGGPTESAPPFSGGALRVYELLDGGDIDGVGLDLEPEAGTLVAFRSSVLHEVLPVLSGQRYTLVTWLMARGSQHQGVGRAAGDERVEVTAGGQPVPGLKPEARSLTPEA
jgi:predicted 2-oxoglutarate/Fe(II)-dependent dioxygenase YbiX